MNSFSMDLTLEQLEQLNNYGLKDSKTSIKYVDLYTATYVEANEDNAKNFDKNMSELSTLHKEIMKIRVQCMDAHLESILKESEIPPSLSEAMRYSLLAGGKRLRPVLCLTCAKLCANLCEKLSNDKNHTDITNSNNDPYATQNLTLWAKALPFATAIEMIHTYSLIHDDLPAMDNDDMRRGKPSCHKAYGDATAILAGDALLTDAFYFMMQCDLPAENLMRAVGQISLATGSQGMVGGQIIDLEAEGRDISQDELYTLNMKKTGSLIRAACVSGAILAGASVHIVSAISSYAHNIGIAFQIIDDILDVEGNSTLLGKNVGSDRKNKKSTWVTLLGVEESKELAQKYCNEAICVLETLFNDLKNDFETDDAVEMLTEVRFLQKIAHDMVNRVY